MGSIHSCREKAWTPLHSLNRALKSVNPKVLLFHITRQNILCLVGFFFFFCPLQSDLKTEYFCRLIKLFSFEVRFKGGKINVVCFIGIGARWGSLMHRCSPLHFAINCLHLTVWYVVPLWWLLSLSHVEAVFIQRLWQPNHDLSHSLCFCSFMNEVWRLICSATSKRYWCFSCGTLQHYNQDLMKKWF